MAAAEALMELVPGGHLRRTGSQGGGSGGGGGGVENEEEKERVMAATYAAYTKRAKLQAEKTKAQQLSRQLKTRLQFARLKVDYGWTRQSLNEVENLYFHLSRARPTYQPPAARTEGPVTSDVPIAGPSTPPTAVATPTESQEELPAPAEDPTTQSTQLESPVPSSSQPQPLPKPESPSLPESTPSRPLSQPSLPSWAAASQPTGVKRSPFVERTRTGGIVRTPQPVERLRTGGKVRPPPSGTSPKKRGRPRIPDASEQASTMSAAANGNGAEGGLTYDSFWNSLGSMKS
ncbi:hypothetical protein FRC09_001877 [Ceratobasidium sp. 395]|nr:hypothetical protein FRC09_001877 [Ceratobasidium sp. 395]